MDDELVPGLLQIGRHALAHHTEADKSDAHIFLRTVRKPLTDKFAARRTRAQG